MYGPVLGIGVSPASFGGAVLGKMTVNGTASWYLNSGFGLVRLNWTWFVFGFTTTPPLSVQVAGVFRHLSAPTIVEYQVPAVGLDTLNSRWKVASTSSTVTGRPLENLIPLRRVKVYVLPPLLTFGIAVARSGTTSSDACPLTPQWNFNKPSYMFWYSCQNWFV